MSLRLSELKQLTVTVYTLVFTTRRYASAVYAMALCLPV